MTFSDHAPALMLTALLLPAFGYLYLRYRDARTLLWFLGFLFSLASFLRFYALGWWGFSQGAHPWIDAAGEISIQISSALFLASLSPLRFRIGRFQVLYVFPYILPQVAYSILLYGMFRGVEPKGPLFFVFPALGVICFCSALLWGAVRNVMPPWLGVSTCALLGGLAFWSYFALGAAWALSFVESANLFMAALLVVFVFRRFSPGVVLSVTGFLAWSLYLLQVFPLLSASPEVQLNFNRVCVMGKVVAALGMIMLALEDELAKNKAAEERERRARHELEAYSKLMLARRRVEDFDNQGIDICEMVVAHSRFAQAALLLHSTGRYRLVGAAGLDAATAKALADVAARIPATGFLAPGTAPPAVEQSQTVNLDLTPWLWPGDDLRRLRFTSVLAVPMASRGTTEGALLLAGMRPFRSKPSVGGSEPLRIDDLLPIELLVGRLQATRSQTMMFERLIDSEKFSHLGQLAANVTQQLNNPLTVVLGYATLLEETSTLDAQDRKAVESILAEARNMRVTLESLARISRPYGDQQAAVSVAELLSDMGELHRSEFLSRDIEFRLSIAPALPRVLCSAQQLRQAVRHCLQFAMDAVETPTPAAEEPKTIRMEAASEGNLVQILVGHSGPAFPNPERAFDPFSVAPAEGEAASLGLSLCATILHDNNGRALAVNLEPQGAAIILELRAA
ncbi:MAG: histidine kinase dimerization/phospho-acceptor domain-containing protein [Terracidiphilus sp.]